jgi:hypothetical protein
MTDEGEHPVRRVYQLRFEERRPGRWGHVEAETEATHAVILIRHREFVTELTFEMGETEQSRRSAIHRRETVERMLALAYDEGDRDARADIRAALDGRRCRA